MKKTVVVCNKCNAVIQEEFKFCLFSERRLSAGDSENYYYYADLCFKCTKILTAHLLKKFEESSSPEERKELSERYNGVEG